MRPFTGKRAILWSSPHCEATLVGEALARLGCEVRTVNSGEQLRCCLQNWPADLLVARACAEVRETLLALRQAAHACPLPPLLVVADAQEMSLYLEAMQNGAFDCIGLPLDMRELERIAGTVFARHKEKRMTVSGEKS
jgi:DNA-binding NtrC family response regulator